MVERPGSNRTADKHEKSCMIKNIVFDLGNVLVSFRPSEFLDTCNYTEPLKANILKDIFSSPHWLALDNGDCTTQEAIVRIAAESSLKMDIIDEIFARRIEILTPIPSNAKLLPALKKQGFRLFYLSNFPADLWVQIRDGKRDYNYDFFGYFEGGLISAEARCSKPHPKIYKDLIEKYSINAGECLYIDDLEINVKGAEAAGMKGITTFGSHEIYGEVMRTLGLNGL